MYHARRGRPLQPVAQKVCRAARGHYGVPMTIKMVVLYTQPADAEEFERHYREVHAPLVEAVPGLVRWESAKIAAAIDGGEQTYSRMAELYFADQAAFGEAMSTPEGKATAVDFQAIAPPGSRLFIAAVD